MDGGKMFELARRGNNVAIKAAIARGENVNAQNEFGLTMLHCAIAEHEEHTIDLLLECCADVTIQDADGLTPLHYAIQHGLSGVARKLIKLNPRLVDVSDKHGNQPLWTASFNANGKYDLVNALLENGADPLHKNKVGLSPIDIPKRKGDNELLNILEASI